MNAEATETGDQVSKVTLYILILECYFFYGFCVLKTPVTACALLCVVVYSGILRAFFKIQSFLLLAFEGAHSCEIFLSLCFSESVVIFVAL